MGEQKLMEKIRFNTDIDSASWSSMDNKWHLVTKSGSKFSCDVLFGCTGYYSYENPYEPKFPGQERFPGTIIHPQKWTEEQDKAIVGKKVALIGSGPEFRILCQGQGHPAQAGGQSSLE